MIEPMEFPSSFVSTIALGIAVLATMTVLWRALGLALARNRWVGERVCKSLRRLLPVVIIALGLHILAGASQCMLHGQGDGYVLMMFCSRTGGCIQ